MDRACLPEDGRHFLYPTIRQKCHGWNPKELREIHSLGPKTREWMVSSRQVPGFGATHTGLPDSRGPRRLRVRFRFSPAFSVILITEHGRGRALVDGTWAPISPPAMPMSRRRAR